MTDDDLLRYARHILLDDIGMEGQQRICDAHAVIVGAGGLGCPAALYLAASGVGRITLLDPDVVDLTNLQRQIGHTTARIGQPKVESLRRAMLDIHPHIQVNALQRMADPTLLDTLLPTAQVVLDCSDNYVTRHLVNAASVRHSVPLVSGAALQMLGHVAVFTPQPRWQPPTAPLEQPASMSNEGHQASACYACLFDETAEAPQTRCASLGVLAPLVGIIGSVQAAEALKLLTTTGQSLAGRLLMLDARTMQWRTMHTRPNPACRVCAQPPRGI